MIVCNVFSNLSLYLLRHKQAKLWWNQGWIKFNKLAKQTFSKLFKYFYYYSEILGSFSIVNMHHEWEAILKLLATDVFVEFCFTIYTSNHLRTASHVWFSRLIMLFNWYIYKSFQQYYRYSSSKVIQRRYMTKES